MSEKRNTGRLLVLILLVLAAGIVAAGNAYYRVFTRNYCTGVQQQLRAIGDLKSADLDLWRTERLVDAGFFSENAALSVPVQHALENPGDAEAGLQVRDWLASIRKHSLLQYDRISLLDSAGVERISVPDQPTPVASVLKQQISETVLSGKIRFVDFYRDEHDQKICLALLIPVLKDPGSDRAIGVIVLRIDPEIYLYPFISRWPTPSKSAETLLVRREGQNVLFLNELKFRQGTALNYRIPLSQADLPAVKAVLGTESIIEGIDYRGIPVIADIRAIPNSPWFMVARMDISEVYQPVLERLWQVALVVGLLLVTAAIGVGFLWRAQSVRYYREKAEAAEALRQACENLDITLKSIGDAVIVTDLEGRVVQINPVAEILTGWTSAEAAGRPLTEVFVIVNSHTRRPAENPIAKALATSKIVGLANDTLLISRNGMECQIADSASPILDVSGRTRGGVLTFRDVSREYEAAAAVERSRSELKAIYDHAPILMCVLNGNRQVLYANNAFVKFTGKSEEELKNGRACGVLGCIHALEDPRGCGFAPACDICSLRIALEDTFRNGSEHLDIEYRRTLASDGKTREVVLLGATALIPGPGEPNLLLCLSDITERENIKEQLRASEELHRSLLEASPDTVAVLDLEGRLTYCSPRGLTMFGADRIEEALGFSALKWLAPEDRERAQRNLELCLRGEAFSGHRYAAMRKDGSHFVVEINAAPLTGIGGEPSGVVSVLRDVTWQAQAQEALRDSEQKFRSYIEHSPLGVAVVDRLGNYIDSNSTMTKLLGYSQSELLKMRVQDMQISEEKQKDGSSFDILLAQGKYAGELMLRRKNGSQFWCHLNSVRIGEDRFLGFHQDFTDRVNGERRIAGSEAELKAIYDNVPIIMCLLDEDRRVVRLNKTAVEFSGRPELELIGLHGGEMLSCIHALDDPRGCGFGPDCEKCPLREAVQDTIESGASQTLVEVKVGLASDGKVKQLCINASTARLEIEGQVRVLLCLSDVTARKQLEAQYLRAQRLESLGILASGVAHDLNNVLSPLLMGGPMLEDALTDDDSRSILAAMMDAVRRGAETVRQLLTFARGGEGERTLVQSKHLIKEVGRLLKQALPKNIQVYTDSSQNLNTLMANPSQLHQVLMNLSVNARDAMPDGGILSITAENIAVTDDQAPLLHTKAVPGTYVVFKVSDTGPGIEPEVLDRIFDPFFTTKPQGQGTGLGLSTVLGIVEKHSGFILVDSRPGQGTVFSVYLPAESQKREAQESSQNPKALDGHGELILVVDDEGAIGRLVRTVLIRHGYEVLLAESASEAIEMFDKNRESVRVVLTDMMMPFMDGRELITRLRALDPLLKIVAFSGLATESKREEAATAGATVFLNKPIEAAQILTVLQDLLRPDIEQTQ